MGIIRKNKKGVSMAELIASIVVISLASTSITAMVITSYKGQLRATQYLMANEMAKTYDAMLARDVLKSNLAKIPAAELKNEDPNDKYVVVTQDLLQKMTKYTVNNETQYGPVYGFLWSDDANFKLNSTTFNHSNVQIKMYVISQEFGYFKTEVTVTYQGDRQVTYSGTHFKE